MIRPSATLAILATLASPAYADTGCMSPSDLAWDHAISKHFLEIDTASKGCVTSDQILRYKAAVKRDKEGQAERVRAILGPSPR